MLKPVAFANAVTAVTVVFYVVCLLLSIAAPDVLFGIAKSWMHTVNLDSVRTTAALSLDTFLLGLVSLSLITWVTTYATILLYNRWSK